MAKVGKRKPAETPVEHEIRLTRQAVERLKQQVAGETLDADRKVRELREASSNRIKKITGRLTAKQQVLAALTASLSR